MLICCFGQLYHAGSKEKFCCLTSDCHTMCVEQPGGTDERQVMWQSASALSLGHV